MKFSVLISIVILMMALSACLHENGTANTPEPSEKSFNATGEYDVIENGNAEDVQAWYDLAVRARTAGDAEIALKAITRAAELQMSPIRIGLEKARIYVSNEDNGAALDELQKVSDSGFTAVNVITSDPVLNQLSGQSQYDELVAKMSIQAYPCEHRDEFSEFDFWLGEWDVHTANGSFAGKNRIEKAQAGCVLVENWVSVTGVSGMSVNYFDISSNEWVQVWSGAGGTQIVIRGGLSDEGLLLEGHINYVANGTSAPFRGLWTPLPDGRVRQFFEQSSDGGETWAPWFEGFYTRTNMERQASEK
ncbi:MAG: hypothetical protein IH930_03740 [Proteobacteria bacterium]|nr:hypothetical protein [Pseudomonadota bacterium]